MCVMQRMLPWRAVLWNRPLLNTFKYRPLSSTAQAINQQESLLKRSLAVQKVNDLVIKCTEFDASGNVKTVSGEFKKLELCTQYGLLPRDLRKLDSGFHGIVPIILVRENSILINLLHIRALIKSDRVLLFDIYGATDSHTQSVFMYDLEGKLRQRSSGIGALPYELRALEAILISVTTALDSEMKVLKELVNDLLMQLEEQIDRDNLRNLLVYSKKLNAFLQKVTLVRDALDEVLDQDDDLAGMYLSEKLKGASRQEHDHAEVEMLIESYYKQTDEIVQTAENLVANIRNTEEIVNIILDANRNSLMLLEIKISVGALGVGSGAMIASLYGMNLKNYLEHTDMGFFGVLGIAGTIAAATILFGMLKLRKVQRVTLWGEGSSKGRKRWAEVKRSHRRSAMQRLLSQ